MGRRMAACGGGVHVADTSVHAGQRTAGLHVIRGRDMAAGT